MKRRDIYQVTLHHIRDERVVEDDNGEMEAMMTQVEFYVCYYKKFRIWADFR